MMDLDSYSINLPGRIVTFYPEDQTADVKICAERIFSTSEDNTEVKDREVLVRVPCHTPSGGGWSMTMPITAGNTCILFFSQVGYDHWFYNDDDKGGTLVGEPVPHLLRVLDDNDAYALVGLNTLPRKILSYNSTDSEWRNVDATQIIRLKEDLTIEIESPTKVSIIASDIEITGNLHVTGTIIATDNITAPDVIVGVKPVLGHVHTNPEGGNVGPF